MWPLSNSSPHAWVRTRPRSAATPSASSSSSSSSWSSSWSSSNLPFPLFMLGFVLLTSACCHAIQYNTLSTKGLQRCSPSSQVSTAFGSSTAFGTSPPTLFGPIFPPLPCRPSSSSSCIITMKGLPDPQHTIKRICATNKYAKSSYEIGKKFEAGISLVGTEVGPVASGQCQLRDAYCRVRDGELWIHNLFIGPHKTTGKYFQHVEKRPRRLLVHKKEVLELMYASARDGQTIVPLKIYLTATHRIKVEVAIGRGIKKYDKREAAKEREIKRGFEKIMKSF